MAETDRPFISYNFSVELQLDGKLLCDGSFAECDGLEMTIEPKTIREGGNNAGPVHLLGPVGYGQLTLKRGMTKTPDLWDWFERVLLPGQGGLRASGMVALLSSETEAQKPVQKFSLYGCLPVKLKAPALNAKDGQLAIEEMTIIYERMKREPV